MKNIIITGGSKGMGKEMAKRFASAKNNLIICSRTENVLKETARELTDLYPESTIKYFVTDLGSREGIENFAGWIKAHEMDIDVLVNNAGNFIPGSIHNEAEGTLEEMINVNLYSAYHLTRALLPSMMENKKGHIFNMCSIASLQAYSNGGAYSISKYALRGFSKNLREEMKPYNIKVTAIYPGAVYTSSWEGSGVPAERIMESEDIAELVYTASILSPQACVEDIMVRPLAGDLP